MTPLELHQQVEEKLQGLAQHIEHTLPQGVCFALLTFTVGESGYTGYVSNANRADMVTALLEAADILARRLDAPRSQYHGGKQ